MKIKIGIKDSDDKWTYTTFVFDTENGCREFLLAFIPEEIKKNQKITIERIE